MEEKYKKEILNKHNINDKELISRIWKNTKKNSFDYLDSIDIIKNKNYAYIQLIIIVGIAFGILIFSLETKMIFGYLCYIYLLIFPYLTHLKINKIKKLIEETREESKIKEISEKIQSAYIELFKQMNKAEIDEKLQKYEKEIIMSRLKSCKTSKDYEKLLIKIKDETNKYRKISKERKQGFSMEDEPIQPIEKIKNCYRILETKNNEPLEEVKTNYKRLIKKYHPDNKNGDEIKIREINEAYTILKEYLKK